MFTKLFISLLTLAVLLTSFTVSADSELVPSEKQQLYVALQNIQTIKGEISTIQHELKIARLKKVGAVVVTVTLAAATVALLKQGHYQYAIQNNFGFEAHSPINNIWATLTTNALIMPPVGTLAGLYVISMSTKQARLLNIELEKANARLAVAEDVVSALLKD